MQEEEQLSRAAGLQGGSEGQQAQQGVGGLRQVPKGAGRVSGGAEEMDLDGASPHGILGLQRGLEKASPRKCSSSCPPVPHFFLRVC